MFLLLHKHWFLYFFIVLSFLIIAFVNSYRYIFSNTNSIKMVLLKKSYQPYSKYVSFLVSIQANFSFFCQTINQISVIIFVLSFNYLLEHKLEFGEIKSSFYYISPIKFAFISLIFVSVILNVFLYYFANIIPKYICLKYPEWVIKKTSGIMYFIIKLYQPIHNSFMLVSKKILMLVFKYKTNETIQISQGKDLKSIYLKLKNKRDKYTISFGQLFENVFQIQELKAQDVLTLSDNFVSLPSNAGIERFKEKMITEKVSKLLIYEKDPLHIIGYYHSLDIIAMTKGATPKLHEVIFQNNKTSLIHIFGLLIKKQTSIAIITNDQHDVIGIITLEDILEQLLGEMNDENEDIEFVDKKLSERIYILSGQTRLSHLKEKYGIIIKNGDFETLENYIIKIIKYIPRRNQKINIHDWQFEILMCNKQTIKVVKLKKIRLSDEMV